MCFWKAPPCGALFFWCEAWPRDAEQCFIGGLLSSGYAIFHAGIMGRPEDRGISRGIDPGISRFWGLYAFEFAALSISGAIALRQSAHNLNSRSRGLARPMGGGFLSLRAIASPKRFANHIRQILRSPRRTQTFTSRGYSSSTRYDHCLFGEIVQLVDLVDAAIG